MKKSDLTPLYRLLEKVKEHIRPVFDLKRTEAWQLREKTQGTAIMFCSLSFLL